MLRETLANRCNQLKIIIDNLNIKVEYEDNLFLKDKDLDNLKVLVHSLLSQL